MNSDPSIHSWMLSRSHGRRSAVGGGWVGGWVDRVGGWLDGSIGRSSAVVHGWLGCRTCVGGWIGWIVWVGSIYRGRRAW